MRGRWALVGCVCAALGCDAAKPVARQPPEPGAAQRVAAERQEALATLPVKPVPDWLLGDWKLDRQAFASTFPADLGPAQQAELDAMDMRYRFDKAVVRIEEKGLGGDRIVTRRYRVTWAAEDRCVVVSEDETGEQEITRIRLIDGRLVFKKAGVTMTLLPVVPAAPRP